MSAIDPNDLPYDVWRANYSAALVLKRTLDARRTMRADGFVANAIRAREMPRAASTTGLQAFRLRIGDANVTDEEYAVLRAEVCGGGDPAKLDADTAREFLADLRRALAEEEEEDRADFRDGGCTCACTVKRGSDGRLANSGDCTCERITSVDMSDDGRWLINREPCTPKENTMTTKSINGIPTARIDSDDDDPVERAYAEGRAKGESATAITARMRNAGLRIDAISDDDDPVAKARAARDRQMADAWKTRA